MKHSKKLISCISAAVMACSMLLPFQAQAAYTLGDVNQDGRVNAKDANLILIEAAKRGTGKGTQDTAMEAAADVNNDHAINAKDANAVLLYAALVGSQSSIATFSEYAKGHKATPTSYTGASMETCKAFMLDMTKQADFTQNGQLLVITFQVNSATPAGSYTVKIAKTDIASWDEKTQVPTVINGEINVGGTPAAQSAMPDKDFALKVNSVSAKAGETVQVTVDLANNPGFCGYVLDIEYDANAVTLASVTSGKDFDQKVETTK